jgi:putative ABC transport system permease protein
VAPVVEASRRARLGGQEMVTNVRGVTPEFLALRNFELAEGRSLDERDDATRARVALAGSWVARKLGDGEGVLGRTIWVGGIPFEIVGVLAEKGMTDGQNEDDQLLVPLETARRRLFNVESLSRLLVQADSAAAVAPVEARTRELLRASHRLEATARDDFDLLSLLRANEIRRQGSVFLRGLSQLFAITTLVVGGAGVLAVTWLNVKERVAEIGLRRALGARQRDVATLFLAEASLLGVAGGIAGVVVGAIAVGVLERTLGWRMAIDPRGVALPFLISVALGLASGVVPAIRAARVTPVEALRGA